MAAAEVFRWGTAAVNTGMLLYALASFARHRDVLRGLLVLLYSTCVVISAVEAYVRLVAGPEWVGVNIAATVYLFHPVVSLVLASKLHHVPRRWIIASVAAATALAIPNTVLERAEAPGIGAIYVVLFVAVQAAAARTFAKEARSRRGISAMRLRSAALAAWCLVLAVFVAMAGVIAGLTVSRSNDTVTVQPAGDVVVLISHAALAASAVGYLLAFVPPQWLRQVWAARALRAVTRRLIDAPATETSDQVWRRYANAVREVISADAVDVVLIGHTGELLFPGRDPRRGSPPEGLRQDDLNQLVAARQPVELRWALGERPFRQARRGSDVGVARHYAPSYPTAQLTAVPIVAPRVRGGALVVIDQRRSLFAADDLRLLADLAGQAAVLAERGAMLQQQQRMADDLSSTVTALTRANSAKNDFLAAMSHELRTPLHAVIGFSDLLRDDLAQDGRRLEWLDHIHRGGLHLLALINGLLDLAKIESGELDLRRVPVRLDTAIEDLVASLRPLIARRELQIALQLPTVTAQVDAMRFRQIVENLLSNAIKFSDAGGVITVRLTTDEADATVSVADTGVGIAAEDQHQIFEAYQQVRTADKRGGTGLGLTLSRQLARAHGGDLTVQSALGLGTTFTLALPGAVGGGAAPPQAGASAQPPLAGASSAP
ncbi:HAMP domain-containing sensor histidine kinase [Pilimelia columellifera]|uniref:histidine kinase n=1 Tax=Pilimelia columellifera subsp. columellifera TaxID=706583 RepID=A0ABP6AYW9_9ACTN